MRVRQYPPWHRPVVARQRYLIALMVLTPRGAMVPFAYKISRKNISIEVRVNCTSVCKESVSQRLSIDHSIAHIIIPKIIIATENIFFLLNSSLKMHTPKVIIKI